MLKSLRKALGLRRHASAPIACFGSGGSGTRGAAAIMQEAGVYLGPRLNRSIDALALKPFLRRWPEEYVERSGWIQALHEDPQADLAAPDPAMLAELRAALEEQREGMPEAASRWGWKAPRSIFVLPAVHRLCPDLRTIQLVRDGRDMAYSSNQNQLDALGEAVLGPAAPGTPAAVRSIELWSRVNVAAANYGRRFLGERHLVVRYEELCEGGSELERLLGHLGAEPAGPLLERARELVEPSPSRGRWREREPAEVVALEAAGAEGLRRFGYAPR